MVIEGYGKGLIKLINSPNGDGIVCRIGDNWFYFGGETASMGLGLAYRIFVDGKCIK